MNLTTASAPPPKRLRDANANAQHLQRLLEKQPSCLMRVNMEGVLLAANDAALSMLGASSGTQVLGKPLTEWMVPEHHVMWTEFAGVVASDTARSLECDFVDLSSSRRTLLLHGVPLLDHPDGTPSIILGARDVSRLRQIEASQEAERVKPKSFPEREQLEGLLRAGRKHLETQREQLIAAAAERKRLESALAEREDTIRQLQGQHDEFARQHTEHHERGAARERDAVAQFEALQAELSQTAAECQRLTAAMTEQEAAYQQVIAEQDEQQRAQAERHQLDLQQRERELQEQIDTLRVQAAQAGSELQHHIDALRSQTERGADLQQQIDAVVARASERDAELLQQIDALQAQAAAAGAERDRLDVQVRNHEAAYQRLNDDRAAHEGALAEQHRLDLEARTRDSEQQLDSLHREVSGLAVELARLQGLLSASAERQTQMAQELADGSVELRYKDLTAAQLTPFAAAGRLALEVGGELRGVMDAIDRGTATLLAHCALDAPFRAELESLRGEAIKAASLTSQLDQARAEAGEPGVSDPGWPGAEA